MPYRPSLFGKLRHARQIEGKLHRWTDADLALERDAGVAFGRLIEQYRQGELVDVGNGVQRRYVRRFTVEEAEFFDNMGFGIPFDLWPHEWWRDGTLPRFGEELLGDEF